jgi:hypothetical protein
MKALLAVLLSLSFIASHAQKQIKLEEVKDHVGDSVNVSGIIYGVKVFEDDDKKPTLVLLNLGADYPNQLLTIAVQPTYQSKTSLMPGENAKGSLANVFGKIELFKGKPQIIVRSANQLYLSSTDAVTPAKQR